MIPDVADRPVHVLEDLGNRELGLAAMHDGEDRIAAVEQLIHGRQTDVFVAREPAATDHPDDGGAVLMGLGCENVHRQGRAIFAAVHHVDLAVERRIVIAPRRKRQHHNHICGEEHVAKHKHRLRGDF